MSATGLEQIHFRFPVFSFALVQSRYKRYNWGLALTMFLPSIMFIVLLNFIDRDLSGGGFWSWHYRIYFRVTLFFLTSLVALLVGTGMFRDMMTNDTIVYLMTKPISRVRIYLETVSAYFLLTIAIVSPGVIVNHVISDVAARVYDTSFEISLGESLYNLLIELFGAYIIVIGLGAIFVTTGLWLKRPLLVNLLIAFGIIIEAFFIDLISDQFEPVYIAQKMVSSWVIGFTESLEANSIISSFSQVFLQDVNEALINFVVILVLTIIFGIFISRRRQFD